MKKFMEEFKEFINKGDVMSMAIGIIIGGAFTTIVNTAVEEIFSPLIGLICGGIDFSSFAIVIGEASFGIGKVVNAIITFLLTAFCLFLILKAYNKVTSIGKKEESKEEETK